MFKNVKLILNPRDDQPIGIILSKRVCSWKPAISIKFNDVVSNNLVGYEERSCVLYMILDTTSHFSTFRYKKLPNSAKNT